MNKHLSESLIAVGLTVLISTVGISTTYASVNESKVNNVNSASITSQVESTTQALNGKGDIPVVAPEGDINFVDVVTSTEITADAKAKIDFSSVDIKSIPKPTPKPTPKPVPTPEPEIPLEVEAPLADGTSTGAVATNAPVTSPPISLPQDMNGYQKYAGEELKRRGMGDSELACLIPLWHKESGWNPNAANPTSSARGIPQMMMGIHYGLDWQTNAKGREYLSNPNIQINVGLNYIQERYGSPCNALNIWNTQSWY